MDSKSTKFWVSVAGIAAGTVLVVYGHEALGASVITAVLGAVFGVQLQKKGAQ